MKYILFVLSLYLFCLYIPLSPKEDRTRVVSTYVKRSIPSELLELPCRNNGIESVFMKLHLQEGLLDLLAIN